MIFKLSFGKYLKVSHSVEMTRKLNIAIKGGIKFIWSDAKKNEVAERHQEVRGTLALP